MHREKSRERILHEQYGLVLHKVVVLGSLSRLAIVTRYNMQEDLLVLGDGLALLREELSGLDSELLVDTERVGHGHLNLFNCLLHL